MKFKKEVPVSLWISENSPDDKMIWKSSYWEQAMFMRDSLQYRLGDLLKPDSQVMVISTHTSKSIELPVYLVRLVNGGCLIMRNNFYDWKVTVISKTPVLVNPSGQFNPDKRISSVYCEGFEDDWVKGPYSESNKEFTVELGYDNTFLSIFFWNMRYWREKVEAKND